MKNSKKGFTLVELLVVIAILAILATVAVVGYTSFTDKAHESNDRTLVAQLNKTLIGGTFETAHDAFEAVRAAGFDVAKIEAPAKNQEILWDMDNKEFFYSADETRNGNIWVVVSDESKIGNAYNNYYVGKDNIEALDVTKEIIVYTEGEAVLSINAPKAHVEHYGDAKEIDVIAVSETTYVENGLVSKVTIKTGRLVIAAEAEVASVVVEKATEVKLETGSTVSAVIVNDAAVKVEVETGANVDAIAPGNDEVKATLKDNVTGTDNVEEEVVEAPIAGDFAGGLGTANAPYLIETPAQLMNISNYYEKGYKYFKVADGVTSLDLTGVGKISLHGSFDGNGVSIVNLTTALFEYVGYQLAEETIKISNITATMNNTDGRAFVRNIHNSGTTIFENVTLHGYIEGLYNLGSFYNYGTANGTAGSDYTVEFINSKSDITIVCTSGNTAGGFLGHSYEGAGNSFTLKIDANSAYTGTIYTTGSGKGNLYFAMTSDYNNALNHFIVNGNEITFDNDHIPAAANVGKVAVANPVAGADGYTVTPVENADHFVVDLNAQVTAYDEEGNKIVNKAGMTWPLGNVEMSATDGKVFDLISSAVIVNGTDHEFGYELKDGVLTIYSGRSDNYADGWVTLQVNQYDDNDNLIAAGSLKVYTITK